MSTAYSSSLLKRAVSAAKAGDKPEARFLLRQSTRLDPESELAWLWLAWVAETPHEAARYLEKVLELNPANAQALEWLPKIRHVAGRSPLGHCPICEATGRDRFDRCPRCHSYVNLSDVEALLANVGVDETLVRRAVERYESLPVETRDAFHYLNLGLAYLNDHRLREGVAHLEEACRLQPDNEVLRGQVDMLSARAARIVSASEQPERHEERVVLVIDDSLTVRKIVAVTLEKRGYRVVVAPDGIQALAKIEEARPDLVILDVTMPFMDGFHVCKVLKGNASTREIPVIMLSGKDGLLDKVRGRMAGATQYLSKPVDPATLLQAVQKLVKPPAQK